MFGRPLCKTKKAVSLQHFKYFTVFEVVLKNEQYMCVYVVGTSFIKAVNNKKKSKN